MPTISRIRIVNFSYNNGHRRIGDQRFPLFFDGKSQDTLLNLENGGGKSVLVQLMMQPILPKVSLNDRKVEDYFTKTGDPAYIMLEWKLDNSEDFLMTGIALCPGENAEEDGGSMRFFTFTAQYGRYGNEEYDINHLNLSTQDGRQYHFASYRVAMDLVRNLQKRFPIKVHYYYSDDVNNYYRELKEFGISREEWQRVVAPINSHEGGVKDLFETFKTSDKLLDGMLIKTIDYTIAGMSEDEDKDASLSQMILNYAQKLVDNQKNLILKKQMQEFFDQLSACREPANKLWKLSDQWYHALGKIFGFYGSLKQEVQKQQKDRETLQTEHKQAQNALSRLDLEESSAEWYRTQEEYQRAQEQYAICNEAKKSAQSALEQNRRAQNIQEAARLNQKLCQCSGRMEGIRAQMKASEQNEELKQQLDCLRYSIFVKASQEREKLAGQQEDLKAKASQMKSQISEAKKEMNSAQNERENSCKKIAVLEDRLTGFGKETKTLFTSLSLDMRTNFLGEYRADEVQAAQDDLQQKTAKTEAELQTCAETGVRLQNEQTKRTEEKSALALQQVALKYQLSASENQISQYHEQEQESDAILERYGLEPCAKFHPEQRESLLEKRMELQAAARGAERKREMAQKQLDALQKGALHLPVELLNELNGLDIAFTTGENWLQQREEQRDHMLELFPELPYCVILTSNDFRRVQSKVSKDIWLPCLGCFVTYDTLDQILREDRPFSAGELLTLSRYAEESLRTRDEYAKKLAVLAADCTVQEEKFTDRAKQTEQDIRTLDSFPYSEGALEKLVLQKEETESSIQDTGLQTKNCTDRLKEITIALDKMEKEQHALLDALTLQKQSAEEFAAWRSKMAEASEWQEEKSNLSRKVEELVQKFDALQKQLQEWQDGLLKFEEQRKTLEEKVGRLSSQIAECSGSPKTSLLPDGITELYGKYQTLQETSSRSVQDLRNQLKREETERKELEVSLTLKKLEPEEYRSEVYSYEKLAHLKEDEGSLTDKTRAAQDDAENAGKKMGGARVAFDLADQNVKKLADSPLEKSAIMGEFAPRKANLLSEKKRIEALISQNSTRLDLLNRIMDKTEDLTQNVLYDGAECQVELEEDCTAQLKNLKEDLQQCRQKVDEEQKKYHDQLSALDRVFSHQNDMFEVIVRPLLQKVRDLNQKEYDRYYEIHEMIGKDLDILEKQIALFQQELSEVDNNRKNLATQCFAHGKRIYEQLNRLSESSFVRLPELARKLRMLKIELPEQVDEGIARERMASYAEEQANLLADAITSGVQASALMKKAMSAVSSRVLLNTYIGTDHIPVKVYKIDMDIQNSDYRLWEKAIAENSGAEKFVVYFAVILSLMYYTRTQGGALTGEFTSTLIMDNPFGPISSEHLLRPMFAIAKRFGVQLICLTDLDTADIVSCFALRYLIRIRPVTYGNYSVVEFESSHPDEVLEQAFYKGEQLNLFH